MDDEINRAQTARRGSPYLTQDQTATYLNISRRYLQQLRRKGEGPVFRRHSTTILYHIDDLVKWSLDRAKEPKA